MLSNNEELIAYIKENYPEITNSRMGESNWDIFCEKCKIVRGFDVIREDYAYERKVAGRRGQIDWDAPKLIYFRCPVCDMYKIWFIFGIYDEAGKVHYYKLTSIPAEGLEDIEQLPEDPPSLRIAYRQAIRAMDANAHIAAAAMFRRALQVITRDILGIPAGNLGAELRATVGKEYNGVKLTKSFSDNAYIVKEAGNQGAHPDRDPDLLDFASQDAGDLQNIFMELVSELFVIPEAIKKTKDDFMNRRKINPKELEQEP